MPRTGRPREFDRDQAVEAAMMLFWAQGYEPTSLSQLKACMGDISAASFYAAFGSKEALFEEVVARYLATHGQATAPLHDRALPARDAIASALRQSARMQTETTHPRGCLVVLGASNCSSENQHVEAVLLRVRENDRRGIEACVKRAIANGELDAATNAAALTRIFAGFLFGIAVEARDGASFAALDASITTLMGVWDAHASAPGVSSRTARRAADRRRPG